MHSLDAFWRGWKSIRCRGAEPIVGGGVTAGLGEEVGPAGEKWEWLRLMKNN